jgi:hypothetical protein
MAGIQRNATAWEDPAEEVAGLFYLGTNPHQRILLLRFYSKLAKFGVMQLSPVPGSCKSNRLLSANEVAREEQ